MSKKRHRYFVALTIFCAGFLFALLCFVALNAAMEPVSTNAYCGSKCHEMKELYRTWELSVHGSNPNGTGANCVDCHLPSKEHYFTHLFAKAYAGAKDIYVHNFGIYDGPAMRQHVIDAMSNETCLKCHDRLLDTPGSSAALKAHQAAIIADHDDIENRCLKCHEDIHEKNRKLFAVPRLAQE